jgi:hypothetical protein
MSASARTRRRPWEAIAIRSQPFEFFDENGGGPDVRPRVRGLVCPSGALGTGAIGLIPTFEGGSFRRI